MRVSENAVVLERELQWLAMVIEASIQLYFGQECAYRDVREIAAPDLPDTASTYAHTLRAHAMSFEERLILILALAPHIRPQLLDPFLMKNDNYGRGFTEFGGAMVGTHGGFLPTVQTLAFILAGDDLARRLALQPIFDAGHFFRKHKILQLDEVSAVQSLFCATLTIGREYLGYLTTGDAYRPDFSPAFPARYLSTPLDWSDLVLADPILDDVEELRAWITHRATLMDDWGLRRKIKPGFRSLFYGPPGTGKTLTASLLGKTTGLDVYCVDLSLVVSKYIGETEKNLAGIFEQAENNDWILFFDEADALFGKRTQTSSAHDRYANQEVAYLLQRIEGFPGIVILATNLKGNIDEAFARRFQSMIYFPMPGPEQRLQLWRNAFSQQHRLEESVDLQAVAQEFELSGGAIINVLRYASLMALRRATGLVRLQDIRQGVRREFRKDGKAI